MATRSLLLDVDGVLIRDRDLLAHVQRNVVDYVRAKLPDCKDPERLNRVLYGHYGHTARGLKRAFQICTKDFDDAVYDPPLISHLWEHLSSRAFQQDAEEVHAIAYGSKWEVTLFSNAPLMWTLPVMHATSDLVRVCHDNLHLKPEARAYAMFARDQHHVFVDDSVKNLLTARHLPNWTPVHFAPEAQQTIFPTLSSLTEVHDYCDIMDLLAQKR